MSNMVTVPKIDPKSIDFVTGNAINFSIAGANRYSVISSLSVPSRMLSKMLEIIYIPTGIIVAVDIESVNVEHAIAIEPTTKQPNKAKK